jgi:hypothetical protein
LCLLGVSALISFVPRIAKCDAGSRVALSLNWMRLAGAESCIDAGRLARSVERHLGQSVFVSPTTATRNIEGWIEPAHPGWHVALRASDADGHPIGHRELASTEDSCASLDRSIVIAIGLLAEAAQGPAVETGSTVTPLDSLASVPPESPRVAPPENTPGLVPRDDRTLDARAATGQAELGPTLGVAWGRLPDIAFGVGLRATVLAHRLWMIDVASVFWVPQHIQQGSASATFARSDLELGACFVPLQSAAARLGTCVGATGGLITAQGEGTQLAQTAHRPVFAGYGRALGLIRLSPLVGVVGAAHLAVPITSFTFYHRAADGTQVDVWSMPAVSAGAELAVVLHFGS